MNTDDWSATAHRALPVLALAVGFLGAVHAVVAISDGAPYEVPITDFGRDLLGAQAAQLGVNPYQSLGVLESEIPAASVPVEASDFVVAHSPLSIAGARFWLSFVGPSLAEPLAGAIHLGSLIVVVIGVFIYTAKKLMVWHGVALAGALTLTFGFRNDLFWLQGSALVAIGLALVFWLAGNGRGLVAILLMGLLVAWRPWLAPVGLMLPNRASWMKDLVRVGIVAASATLLALPYLGGWAALSWWIGASSINMDFYLDYSWNLSLIGHMLPPPLAMLCFVAVGTTAASQAKRLPPQSKPALAALVILTFSPLVWPHHWLALLPALVLLIEYGAFRPILSAVLLLAWPVAGFSPALARLTSLGAGVVLSISVYDLYRSSGEFRSEPGNATSVRPAPRRSPRGMVAPKHIHD
ncbi:MAG: hypothetical protein ACRDWS_08885 [Acidimicrobiia bacterium]